METEAALLTEEVVRLGGVLRDICLAYIIPAICGSSFVGLYYLLRYTQTGRWPKG